MGYLRAVAIACVLALAGGLSGCGQAEEHQQGAPPPLPVTVATPLQKTVTDWDEFTGRFEASNFVEVRSRVSGTLMEVHFKDGQDVKKGDLLFTIDKRPFQRAVEQAQAELARSKSTVEFARADLERAEPLVARGTVSVQSFQDRKRAQGEAEAAVQSAEARLKAAQLDLEFTEVRAPLNGRISNRRVDVGNFVSGGGATSTLLTTIVSTDPIYFVFDASESDFLRYSRLAETGQRPSSRNTANPVKVQLMDEETWAHEGTMNFVDNRLDPNSGTIRGRAVFENKDGFLVPGVFGRLRLVGSEPYEALLVPEDAVVSDQARKLLMTVDAEGKVAPKVIELGPIHEGLRVVRSGIGPDDRVVIDGVQRAMPGQKVPVEEGKIEPQPPGESASATMPRG